MEPIEFITSDNKVKLLIDYLNDLGIDLRYSVVPFGIDYDCYKKGCKRKFRQFTRADSPDITTEVMAKLDNGNIVNKEFSINGAMRDAIGLGMGQKSFILFKLGEFNIKGIMCSTNKIPIYAPTESKTIGCGDKVQGNQMFAGAKSS